jgi:hypothetical protein
MRNFKHLAAAAATAALVLGGGGAAASAAISHPAAAAHPGVFRLRGGQTSVTTGAGIAAALLSHQIVPLAAAPGSQTLLLLPSGPAAVFTFPVTGGKVSLHPLGATIAHRGGIVFVNTANGKEVEVSNFVISLARADLTGIVNGNPKDRVVLMWLHLAHARLRIYRHWVVASGIGVTLSATAASALDASLGTTLFTPGLPLGHAQTRLHI